MAVFKPITLSEGHLGQRHHRFNSLVEEASMNGVTWQDIEKLPENSPLDRLFKIEIASKLKYVDYIISNLKDDDLLYVSKALKSPWLIDPKYSDIINPTYLDTVLFPAMTVPAVSKMKHWLYINLRDSERCLMFYDYYKEKNFNFALKFLRKCEDKCILEELPKMLIKISPHDLKIFSERCAKVAKIYFDALSEDIEVTRQYLKSQLPYYNSIKCVLKSDPDIFLEITEKFYNNDIFPTLSPAATQHIIKHCKARFTSKPELYAAWLLHLPTLAKQLTVAECEDLVLKLARAEYLVHWFSYQAVEPLIKRLSPDKRAAFKKKVFSDKDFGTIISEWPYPTPRQPIVKSDDCHVFDDLVPDISESRFDQRRLKLCMLGCPRKYKMKRGRTELDGLFDEYRFHGFDYTFNKLSRKLAAAGAAETRRSMFLVLVSKAGERSENISVLLKLLLERHINEPDHIRAAIIRSFVKRGCVWRVPDDTWGSFLEFGCGLGLDGAASELTCVEGFHAVILRLMLSGSEMPAKLRSVFLHKFSTLSKYSLSPTERTHVLEKLTLLLVTAASESNSKESSEYLLNLFQVYEDYKIRIDAASPIYLHIISAVKDLSKRDAGAAKNILIKLYDARVARKELFLVNLEFRHDDASYLNALRHDPSVVTEQILKQLTDNNSRRRNRHHRNIRRGQFIQKVALYFSGDQGLAEEILEVYKTSVNKEPDVKLARLIAILSGRHLKSYIKTLDSKDVGFKRIANALRGCGYYARPKLDIDAFEPHELGAHVITTRALVCRYVDCEKYVNLLLNSRRTVRAAIIVSQRNCSEATAFAAAAKLRPAATIKALLPYFRNRGDNVDPKVWEIVKPLIMSQDFTLHSRLWKDLNCQVENVPLKHRPEYCATLYSTWIKTPQNRGMLQAWQHKSLLKYLPGVRKEIIEEILLKLLADTENDISVKLPSSLIMRYLLLSESESDQKERFEKIGQKFFDRVATCPGRGETVPSDLNVILKCLKYDKVFFDTKYACSLPVFERVLAWMRKMLPIEKHFKKYAEIHLSMLYFKAIRQSIKEDPQVFNDQERKLKAGVAIVGTTFGRYIATEWRELVAEYFDSIIEVSREAVIDYLSTYFMYGSSKLEFVAAVIKGIVEESNGGDARLGIYILKDNKYSITSQTGKELKGILKNKDDATKFFLYAELPDFEDNFGI